LGFRGHSVCYPHGTFLEVHFITPGLALMEGTIYPNAPLGAKYL
jgi:hypothetical protein